MRVSFALGICIFLVAGCSDSDDPEIGDALAGLTVEQLGRFEEGRGAFNRVFSPANGLGPLFNAEGCGVCHSQPVAGGGSQRREVHATRFIPPDTCDALVQEGGPVVQRRATPLLQAAGIAAEDIPPSRTATAFRTTPPLFGFGLIDAIPEATILANEDPNDADGDGISGRANRSSDGRVGRFGRKATVATLFDFNAGAFLQEQGITTPLNPAELAVNGMPLPAGTDPTPDPEMQSSQIEAATNFVRFLAPPQREPPGDDPKSELVGSSTGEQIFQTIGCASCHIPSMNTGPNDIPALSNQVVFLFSDLLLHDMGPDLADICMELAEPSEFRTEFLMGLRFRQRFLHDGSAMTLREAIERHGGEALGARNAFVALSVNDQNALLSFLNTI